MSRSSLRSSLAALLLVYISESSYCSFILSRHQPFESILTPFPPNNNFPVIPASSKSSSFGAKILEHQLVANATETGLTLNYCDSKKDCKGDRECHKWKKLADGPTCGIDWLCICFPPEEVPCSSSEDCDEGEICAETMRTATPICLSPTADAPFEPHPWLPWAAEVPDEVRESPSADDSDSPSKGLTYDECRNNVDCEGDRVCEFIGIFSEFDECNGRQPCYCSPQDLKPCFGTQDCVPDEVCSEVALLSFAVCISKTTSPLGKREVPFTGISKGLNLDTCTSSEDCRGDRICSHWGQLGSECFGQRPCICFAYTEFKCDMGEACVEGEVCSSLTLFIVPVCISEAMADTYEGIREVSTEPENSSPSNTPQPTPDNAPKPPPGGDPEPNSGVADTGNDDTQDIPESSPGRFSDSCIDSRALQHLKSEELVFRRHRLARVLCDTAENCATEGHMVLMRGKAMMMRTYCDIVGCVEREMHVNNPRYRKGKRVHSNSGQLVFTAFAARYASKVEEGLLSVAVHVGL